MPKKKKKKATYKVKTIDAQKATKELGLPKRASSWLKWTKDMDGIAQEIRILPPLEGWKMEDPWMQERIHTLGHFPNTKLFAVDGENRMPICLDYHFGKPCPFCQIDVWCEENGENNHSINARARFHMNVVHEDRLKVWVAPPTVVEQLQDYIDSKKWGVGIFDPKKGRNFDVTRERDKKTGFYGYLLVPDPEKTAVTIPDWFEKVKDPIKAFTVLSYEEAVKSIRATAADVFPLDEIFDSLPF